MRLSSAFSKYTFWVICLGILFGCQKSQEQVQERTPETTQEQATQNGYKVIGIKDGDTVELLKDGKPLTVRLQGVDCPEKNQDFGTRARQFTSDLVFGKYVELVVENVDRYGRTVGEIILPDGRNLNQELVKNGFAWHYTAYSKDQELARLEAEARAEKRGLWEGPSPQAPWEFRQSRRGKGAASANTASTKTKTPKTKATAIAKGGKVYICQSKGSKTFHTDQNCYLMEQCKSPTAAITLAQAQKEKRTPCKTCAD
ncbi:thermonuclease family protein [Rufibacter latericius]|uniref:SNase-like nuclease n=1 Tax=Rufibacter latericius TaxID=2487040 RepID=A0A3M9MKC5_9BACT|nr:thermonuclease family protein [Rufibacter latericius]RNI25655.1 SNase-like nuclease [Rufibacter latericius]